MAFLLLLIKVFIGTSGSLSLPPTSEHWAVFGPHLMPPSYRSLGKPYTHRGSTGKAPEVDTFMLNHLFYYVCSNEDIR